MTPTTHLNLAVGQSVWERYLPAGEGDYQVRGGTVLGTDWRVEKCGACGGEGTQAPLTEQLRGIFRAGPFGPGTGVPACPDCDGTGTTGEKVEVVHLVRLVGGKVCFLTLPLSSLNPEATKPANPLFVLELVRDISDRLVMALCSDCVRTGGIREAV